jgi:short subunit dehydrogenase-like uncharacterized protein
MATFNTRVVRRSNALQDWAYGRRFRYSEVMGVGRSPLAPALAAGTALGIGGLGLGMALPPTRFLLDRVLPSPGQGPSQSTRDNGTSASASTRGRRPARATTASWPPRATPGTPLPPSCSGRAPCAWPGRRAAPAGGGVLTPATAMGSVLADRLRAQGFTLEVSRS